LVRLGLESDKKNKHERCAGSQDLGSFYIYKTARGVFHRPVVRRITPIIRYLAEEGFNGNIFPVNGSEPKNPQADFAVFYRSFFRFAYHETGAYAKTEALYL
jgi:hypothetical protein